MKTKIFLDSGDPAETKAVFDALGFLDGQTTNPSLFSKSPEVQARIASGNKYTIHEIYTAYRSIIESINTAVPGIDVSIEVAADDNSTYEGLLEQAKAMSVWAPNYHIKLPITKVGLAVAQAITEKGIPVNMTLCFTEEQAAAVYAATSPIVGKSHYVSPFIGRLDDIGIQGSDLVENISTVFEHSDHHVSQLSASIRDIDHLLYMLSLEVDIVTVPAKILLEWAANGKLVPKKGEIAKKPNLEAIPYKETSLALPWESYNIQADLTDKGLAKFASDWNSLLK